MLEVNIGLNLIVGVYAALGAGPVAHVANLVNRVGVGRQFESCQKLMRRDMERGSTLAHKEFILQGFTTRTHGDAIRELFDTQKIHRVILSVAFITESGVNHIESKLKPYAKELTVFAGIRNDISTHQALKLLHSYGGTLYAVDTGARNIVFHPKLYLVRGEKIARMIVGSANLTLGGLNNNIEAGMVFEFDLSNVDDDKIVKKIEAELDTLPISYPKNVIEVTGLKQLDGWLASGRLSDEVVVPPPHPSSSTTGGAGASDAVPRIKLKVDPLRRAIKKAKKAVKKVVTAGKTAVPLPPPVPATIGVRLELVWESKALTKRDLQIPDGGNTHRTGSINLDQGLLPKEIDFQTYFRDEVFSELKWGARSATVEEAYICCHLILKGVSYGDFDIAIRHTTSKLKTQKQRNALSRLSWGPMRPYIARADLIKRNLVLYRDEADPTQFVLEID
ncbi:MAG: hypothetical protein K8F90_16150 [Hyphomicrobiales bacterium]|nr:hypothetical protein [Hyphomicrobiales bacterium]